MNKLKTVENNICKDTKRIVLPFTKILNGNQESLKHDSCGVRFRFLVRELRPRQPCSMDNNNNSTNKNKE